jgi:hypothetical protein
MVFFFNGAAHCRVFDSANSRTLTFPKNETVVVRSGERLELRNSQTGSIAAFDIADVDTLMGMTPANALTLLRPLFFACCPASCVPDFTVSIPTLTVTPPGGSSGTTRLMGGSLLWTGNGCCLGDLTLTLLKAYAGTPNNSIAYTSFVAVTPASWSFSPAPLPVLFAATFVGSSVLTASGTHYVFAATACGKTYIIDKAL